MLASRTVPGIDKCSMENEWMQGWHWEDTYMDFHNLNWHFLEAGMTWPSWKQKHIFFKKKERKKTKAHIYLHSERASQHQRLSTQCLKGECSFQKKEVNWNIKLQFSSAQFLLVLPSKWKLSLPFHFTVMERQSQSREICPLSGASICQARN